MQVPVAQLSHWVPQLVLQQMPSTQWPLVHWALPLQTMPLLRGGTQLPLMQTRPVAQPVLAPEHVVAQAVAPHVNVPQDVTVGIGHLPSPSHVTAEVALFVVGSQEAAPQLVPLAA